MFGKKNALPETNIAPENRPTEKDIPIGNHHLLGAFAVSFRVRVAFLSGVVFWKPQPWC